MEQVARNVSGEDGFLVGKKYLIHDRDTEGYRQEQAKTGSGLAAR